MPFLAVLALSFIVGCFCSKRAKGNDSKGSDYFLASRQLGWFLLTMTFAATQIGGGFILGTADSAAQIGPYAILFPIGYCLGFLALGLGFGAKLQSLQLNTASDVFERYYDSSLLKKIAALLSVLSLTGILIAQAVGLKKFLFSVGWTDEWIFLAAWSIVILYTTQGGFLAVVWTDAIQGLVMIGMLIGACLFTMYTAPDFSQTLTNMASIKWEAAEDKILGFLIMPFLFTFIEQDMLQRCFAAKSKRAVTIAGCLSACILFALAIIPVYFGMLADELGIKTAANSTFMEVVKVLTNPFVASIAASAILLAIISTASSLLSAVSSNISQDFVVNKKLSITRMKAITFGIGIVALIGSYTATNILSCMIASYELSVACLFVPLVMGVFLQGRAKALLPAAILSVACGGAGFILVKAISLGWLGDIMPLALSAAGYGVGAVFFTPIPEQALERE